jgi:hypothetical protein
VLVGDRGHGRPQRGQPLRGDWIAIRPAARRRWSLRGRRRIGQRVVGQPGRNPDRRPPLVEITSRPARGERGQRGQPGLRRRLLNSRLDDGRVGEHPAGGEVAPLSDPVPGQPKLAYDRELPRPADPVDA